MKTKKMILVAAMAIGAAALMAFTMMPNTPDGDNPQKNTVVTATADDNGQEVGSPCPCSNYRCGCGGTLEWSSTAYKEDLGECTHCKGTGQYGNPSIGYSKCGYCDGTGRKWKWHSGCKCKSCGAGYDQPNDC